MPAARVADRSPASISLKHSNKIIQENKIDEKMERHENDATDENSHSFILAKNLSSSNVANISAVKSSTEEEKEEEKIEKSKELCRMLLDKREQLEEELVQRIEELKKLCIAEGELTGQMPEEVYKTLLPGEPEPHVRTRIGTAFKFPQELIQQRENEGDEIGQLEVEIELNRRIVAAAERLANDRSANKSVRKKRRKDLQAATLRLRGLEKGLNRMRLSSSKPDVSSLADGTKSAGLVNAGSGFSLNSLRNWPNFFNSIRITTKSCPSTPRGSVPDLSATIHNNQQKARKQTPSTTKKLHNLLRSQQQSTKSSISSAADSASNGSDGGCPSSSSSLSLNVPGVSPKNNQKSTSTSTSSGISSAANGSLASTSNLFLTAPPVPLRRSSAGNCAIIVRRPTPPRQRRSASRDHFITKAENSKSREEDLENHLYANIGYFSSVPYKSAYRQSNFPTMQSSKNCQQNASENYTNFSANKQIPIYYNGLLVDNQSLTAAASNQMGQIVRQLDSGHPSNSRPIPCHPFLSSSALPQFNRLNNNSLAKSSFSTESLDRRAMRMAAANANTSRFLTTHSKEFGHHRILIENGQKQQQSTTFPVTETIRPLETTDFARFRSISAVLDHQKKIAGNSNRQLPSKDERMEALLASIHSQKRNEENNSFGGGNSDLCNSPASAISSTSTMV